MQPSAPLLKDSPPPAPDEILNHLERVLANPTLSKSRSLTRLLRYLIEQALADPGAGAGLKEYTLGVEVFDRGANFDPREDNIVRVQARNLRARLADYYAGEGKDDPLRIELPKGGYAVQFRSLHVPVEENAPAEKPAAPKPMPRWVWRLAAALLLLTSAAAGGYWLLRRGGVSPTPPATPHVVAVLPFSNVDPNSGLAYFADGLAEELINSLAALDGLSVIARTSSFQFRGGEPDLAQIGAKLNASEVVEGSVRREGSQIRVNVRLVAVPSGRTLWSSQFDRSFNNTIRTEEEIAYGVSTALKLKLAPSRPPRETLETAKAHDLYLQGRYYWEKIDPDSAPKAVALFEQAINADPDYSPPYVGLAGAYGTEMVWHSNSAREAWPKMKALLTKALELDDSNAEAHTLMGGVAAWYEFDYARSEREYRRGVALGPGDVRTHQYFASMLGAMGRFAEADAEMKKSLRLDPVHPYARWASAQLDYWKGDWKQAQATLDTLHREDPGLLYVYRLLVPVRSLLGDHKEALALAREFVERSPGNVTALATLGEAYARAGQPQHAKDILLKLSDMAKDHYVSPFEEAIIFTALNDQPSAFRALAVSIDERSFRPPWLRVDPRFQALRNEPGYLPLLKSANLTNQ